MSKSFRDEPPRYLAARRIAERSEAELPLPRVIRRRPRDGDVHPLSPKILRFLLKTDVPKEFLYGLKSIELRERRDRQIGQPYGEYRPDERVIVLYSLPTVWVVSASNTSSLALLTSYGAMHTTIASGVEISWKNHVDIATWFFIDVVAHELGHHYRNQYRISVGPHGSTLHEEWQAELRSRRIGARIYARREAKRLSAKSDT